MPTHGAYYIDYLEVFAWVICFQNSLDWMIYPFLVKPRLISEIRSCEGMNVETPCLLSNSFSEVKLKVDIIY